MAKTNVHIASALTPPTTPPSTLRGGPPAGRSWSQRTRTGRSSGGDQAREKPFSIFKFVSYYFCVDLSDGAAQLDMVFHHELKDALTSLAFPPAPQQGLSSMAMAAGGGGDPEVIFFLLKNAYFRWEDVLIFKCFLSLKANLSGLARAAVAGDEKALDLLVQFRFPIKFPNYLINVIFFIQSSWRPSDANRFRAEASFRGGGGGGGSSNANPNTAYAGSSRVRISFFYLFYYNYSSCSAFTGRYLLPC